VDVGCKDGTQTTFFSGCVQQTIGVDVSQAAIVDIANKSNNTAEGVTYQVLDLLNDAACHDFHESTGDAHVYMRGVLMQFLPTDCRCGQQSPDYFGTSRLLVSSRIGATNQGLLWGNLSKTRYAHGIPKGS
jgi:hypothetical protein